MEINLARVETINDNEIGENDENDDAEISDNDGNYSGHMVENDRNDGDRDGLLEVPVHLASDDEEDPDKDIVDPYSNDEREAVLHDVKFYSGDDDEEL